jgi:hypothetical protein
MDIQHNQFGEPEKGLREAINKLLQENFGIDTITGLPMWRVSWSEDQFEKRLGTYTDYSPEGIYLRTVTEVREVPKYRQWIRHVYVLEHLVGIPANDMAELPTAKMSYEPLFPLWDKNGNYMPPNYLVCEFVINCVYAAMGKASLRRYIDPEIDGNQGIDAREKRVNELFEAINGSESGLGGSVVFGEGVAGFYPEGRATKANEDSK